MRRYYVRGSVGKDAGPFTADELRQLTAAGFIPIESEVCEDGASTWYPIAQVPDLLKHVPGVQFLSLGSSDASTSSKASTASDPDTHTDPVQSQALKTLDQPSHSSEDALHRTARADDFGVASVDSNSSASRVLHHFSSTPRPWVRFWARVFDTMLFGLVAGMVLGVIVGGLSQSAKRDLVHLIDNQFVRGWVVLLLWQLTEGAVLSRYGMTVGKSWLGIRVRARDGGHLRYGDAMRRSLRVWCFGLGLGLPIVNLFTLLGSYSDLSRLGITEWDDRGNVEVRHREIGQSVAALFVLALPALVVANFLTWTWALNQ